ncbi:MAG: hypothetical protein Kow0065_22590 [Methylomicrobium sp.]
MTVELENTACPLGCAKNDAVVLVGRDRLHDLPGEFTVVECRSCGLMRTSPRPTPETIGFYYPDDYGPYLGTQVRHHAPTLLSTLKSRLKIVVQRLIDFNTSALPPLEPGRMLELGCASGVFLHRMANLGWDVQGIEFSQTAAKMAADLGYRVHAGPLETAPTPDGLFDLIVGWMVLEHLHDPAGGLKKLREWAKPDAWLVLSVPNAASLEFRLFKHRWYALQLPTHLYHFTPQSLGRMLEASGWKLEKVHHQRILSNLIASTGYLLCDKGFRKLGQKLIEVPESSAGWAYLLYPLAWLFSCFSQTGRMTVWARPADQTTTETVL